MTSSDASLTQRLESLREQVEKLSIAAGNAGLSIGVIHERKTIHRMHHGHQNLRTKESPNDDTVYHLGSLSKALVAAGLAILVDEGQLEWESRLLDVIPGFHLRDKEVESQATLIDLLSHQLGLAMRMNYWAQMQQELLLPPNEAVNVLGALHKTAEFRSTLKYNNWTYAVAGQLIEKKSGMSLEEFMQKHFFEPLNLKRTTFGAVSEDNYSSSHVTLSDGTPFEVPRPRIGSGTLMAGAAGLKSSLDDLLRLYDSLLSAINDQKRTGLTSTPGSPFKQTAMMLAPHGKKGSTKYGLGWFLTELPGEIGWIGINDGRVAKNPIIGGGISPTQIAYHNGSMPGFLTSVHLIPETHTAIVILGNTLSFADLPDYVGGMILNTILQSTELVDFHSLVQEAKNTSIQGPLKTAEKLKTEQKLGTSHRPLNEYEGRFINPEGNFMLEIKIHGDGLRLNVQGLPETFYDLHHYHDDVFAWDCDRDAEAKRAMFPQLSDAFRKICFESEPNEPISQIFWAYARDEPEGEVFVKEGLSRKAEQPGLSLASI